MELTRMRRSRALEAVGYDAATARLRVRFRHGGTYDYLGVEPEVVEGLRASAHPWTEWRERILEHEVERVEA